MKSDRPPEPKATREERIRSLGFDPRHLTPHEQAELLELQSVLPGVAAVSTLSPRLPAR